MFIADDARRPTGMYVPPGVVATVEVPDALLGKGFVVRVGAHTKDLFAKHDLTRLDRVSTFFPILCGSTQVSNPLGGGIYIEVPYKADEGFKRMFIKTPTHIHDCILTCSRFLLLPHSCFPGTSA